MASSFVELSERNLSIADAVGKMADEIGATAAQVARNWVRQRGVIPIIGARKVSQVKDNLACLSFTLTEAHMQRLHGVSQIDLGFLHAFLAREGVRQFVYGGMFERIDNHRSHLAL